MNMLVLARYMQCFNFEKSSVMRLIPAADLDTLIDYSQRIQ